MFLNPERFGWREEIVKTIYVVTVRECQPPFEKFWPLRLDPSSLDLAWTRVSLRTRILKHPYTQGDSCEE